MTDTKKPDLKVPPTMEDVDPFDPKAFSLTPDDGMTAEVGKQVLMTVPVRKPGKAEFFRVHPDSDFTSTIALLEHDRELFRDKRLESFGGFAVERRVQRYNHW